MTESAAMFARGPSLLWALNWNLDTIRIDPCSEPTGWCPRFIKAIRSIVNTPWQTEPGTEELDHSIMFGLSILALQATNHRLKVDTLLQHNWKRALLHNLLYFYYIRSHELWMTSKRADFIESINMIVPKHDGVMTWKQFLHMMTSSNGNIFRVTGILCWESTGHQWIPIIKATDAELMFSLICAWTYSWANNKIRYNMTRQDKIRQDKTLFKVALS